jgi:hypothetical protein
MGECNNVLVGYPQGVRKATWEYPDVDGTIMLKWIYRENGTRKWAAFLA